MLAVLASRHRQILVAALFGVISLGLLYSIRLGGNLRFGDEQEYFRLARNLSTSHSYTMYGTYPEIFRPPGYPFLLAMFMSIGAGVEFLRFVNFLALAASIYIVYLFLRKVSPAAGAIGVILTVLYPVLFYTAGTLYPQTVAACMFLICMYIWSQATISRTLLVVSGLIYGCLILTVPTFAFMLFILICARKLYNRYLSLRDLLVVCICVAGILGIWGIRNYEAYHSVVFVSTNSGQMLLMGNSENTTPNNGPNADIDRYSKFAGEHQLNEVEREKYYKSSAAKWIMKHKSQAAKLYLLKTLNYFNYRNELATRSEESRGKDLVMIITYGPLLLLFLIRVLCAKTIPLSAPETFFALLYILNAFASAVFFTRIRYRLPVDYLLIYIVAAFLYQIANRYVATIHGLRTKELSCSA
jgi:hypothetical protein